MVEGLVVGFCFVNGGDIKKLLLQFFYFSRGWKEVVKNSKLLFFVSAVGKKLQPLFPFFVSLVLAQGARNFAFLAYTSFPATQPPCAPAPMSLAPPSPLSGSRRVRRGSSFFCFTQTLFRRAPRRRLTPFRSRLSCLFFPDAFSLSASRNLCFFHITSFPEPCASW